MKTLVSIFIMCCWLNVNTNAQTKPTSQKASKKSCITITEATEQQWSGGIAGRMGTYYNIIFETKPNVATDTLWIASYYFVVTRNDSSGNILPSPFTKLDKGNNVWKYSLRVNVDRSEDNHHYPNEQQKPKNIGNPPKYDGEAYITYLVKGIRYGYAIKSFTHLEPLNYP